MTNDDQPPAAAPDANKQVRFPFGDIVWLMIQSPQHRHIFLADLEWMVAPPLALNQARIFYNDKGPICVALWASVSDEVDKALTAGRNRLQPGEWNSGENVWLIEFIAPSLAGNAKALENMLAEAARSAYPGRKFKLRRANPQTGKPEIVTAEIRPAEAEAVSAAS